MQQTMRRSMITTFCAFVLFGMGYIAIGRVADPIEPFNAVARLHPQVGITFKIFTYGGVLAFLVMVLGGLPVLFTAVKRSFPNGLRGLWRLFAIRPRVALKLFMAALLITICFLSFLLATEYFFSPKQSCIPGVCITSLPLIILGYAAITGVVTLMVFVILALVTSLSQAVLHSEFSEAMLRFALIPVTLTTLIMACATIASAFWATSLWIVAPQFAASGAGLGDGQTAWVIAIELAMAFATMLSVASLRNGLHAFRPSAT